MKTVTYAITVCNELEELKRLTEFLDQNKNPDDQVLVVFDFINGDPEVKKWIERNCDYFRFKYQITKFEGDFAAYKNKLFEWCNTEYIFQIDADELPHKNLITNLPALLENDVDLFYVPRVNTVSGITQEHIQRWRWRQDENGWVNFPDFQGRIYKNSKHLCWEGEVNLKWEGKVHERIVSHSRYAHLPQQEEWSLYHPKTIDRQEKQNNFYETI